MLAMESGDGGEEDMQTPSEIFSHYMQF